MKKFKATLYPFQKETVEFCNKTKYSIMNLDMGLGKSVTSLAIAIKYKKTLIVCPAFLRKNWIREVEKFTENFNYEITSYRSFSKIKDLSQFDCVIFDEAHYLKNKEAQRTKNIYSFLLNHSPDKVMLLTGTPVANRVSDFWSLLQICYLGGGFDSFKEFHKRYYHFCNTFSYERSFDVNGATIVRFDGLRKKNIPKLQAMIKYVMIRKKAHDCLELPEQVEIDVVGDSSKYDSKLLDLFNSNDIDLDDPAYMSLKKQNSMAKISDTYKLACELIEQGNRPLIFTCHIDTAKELAKKLKTEFITGEVVADKRQTIIDKFNNGGLRALVATIGSTSTGFNITSTNYTIFNDYDFTPAIMEQAKKRTHRIGQNKNCFYYYILTSEFDQKLKDMVLRKDKDINAIMEGV